jgi:transglutaminase-like putative cysteine protease
MNPFPLLSLLGISLLLFTASAKAQEIPESLREAAPPPDWVEIADVLPESVPPHADVANGEYYLNTELQWHLPSKTRFFRTVVEIMSESGLEENGQWTFTFDPLFETQRIHWIRIIRDGTIISTYDPNALRVYNTESDVASRLLNGSLTALAILEDLRVGDIVDIASSVEGANPAFGDEAVLRRRLDWSVPVYRQLNRILAERDRPLQIKSLSGEPLREVSSEQSPLREWRHELLNNKPVLGESSVPAEVRVYGELQVSSFDGWAAVADWALTLYPEDTPLPEELRAECERIAATHSDPAARAKAALAYVQSNVRYLGLEMGHGAYQPRAPELVWQRRFGDCKDKSLLLVQMLKDLGIDAHPALVNTGLSVGIADFLPSPFAFDHVIVTAEIGGVRFWMDPTYSRQIGPLETLPVADYGYALLIKDGVSALTAVNPHPEYKNFVEIETELTIARPGELSTMAVVSRYGGTSAANMKSYFDSTARSEIGQAYTNYWASTYAHPELVSPVEYEEFPESGQIETREYFRIPDAWVPSNDESDPQLYFTFTARSLVDHLVFPDRVNRQFPLAVGEPISIKEKFQVELFEAWDAEPKQIEVTGPGVRYSAETTWGSVVEADFSMDRTLATIPPDQVLAFETANQRINGDANWELSWNPSLVADADVSDETAPKFDNAIAFLIYGCGLVLSALFFGPFLFKHRLAPPKSVPEGSEAYVGVKGWLILPIIGLVLTPLTVLGELFDESMLWIFSQSEWDAVVQANSSGMIFLIGTECIYNGFVLLAPLFLLILLFKRRWFLPALMIGFYTLQIVFLVGTIIFLAVLDVEYAVLTESISEDIGGVVALLIWISYFAVSKRVKATFRS